MLLNAHAYIVTSETSSTVRVLEIDVIPAGAKNLKFTEDLPLQVVARTTRNVRQPEFVVYLQSSCAL